MLPFRRKWREILNENEQEEHISNLRDSITELLGLLEKDIDVLKESSKIASDWIKEGEVDEDLERLLQGSEIDPVSSLLYYKRKLINTLMHILDDLQNIFKKEREIEALEEEKQRQLASFDESVFSLTKGVDGYERRERKVKQIIKHADLAREMFEQLKTEVMTGAVEQYNRGWMEYYRGLSEVMFEVLGRISGDRESEYESSGSATGSEDRGESGGGRESEHESSSSATGSEDRGESGGDRESEYESGGGRESEHESSSSATGSEDRGESGGEQRTAGSATGSEDRGESGGPGNGEQGSSARTSISTADFDTATSEEYED